MVYFMKKDKWEEIERGYEYEAAMVFPSDTKRPLSFFMPDAEDPLKGSITENIGDFSAEIIDGNFRAKTHQIVMNIKPRKVVILSNNVINKSKEFEYIIVAPINTVKPYEKQKDWFQLLVKDRHPIYTYLPKGENDRYIDLSQSIGIHKSLLLKKYDDIGVERLEVLEEDLLNCLSLGVIDEEGGE